MLVPHEKHDQRIVETLAEGVATDTPATQVVLVFWPEDEERLYGFVSSQHRAPPEAVFHLTFFEK